MKYLFSVFAFILCLSCFAQYDNESFDFKRNSIRVGIGSQGASNFPVQYRSSFASKAAGSKDFEIEFERQFTRYFSAGILYKLVDYDLRRYLYREHQRQINFFYAPFNNSRRIQLKLGAGLIHSTIQETNYLIDTPGLSYTRYSSFDWGIIGIAELNYSIVKNISVGIKGFRQMTSRDKAPYGGLIKLGYSF